MRFSELLIRKKFVDEKIELLRSFIIRLVSNDKAYQEELIKLRKELDECLEESQKYSMKIANANDQIEVTIGSTKVMLRNAVKIRDTMKKKIDNISELIANSNGNIDVLSFVRQQGQLIEEYLALESSIKLIEWSAELD